jgi:hypothetical protein
MTTEWQNARAVNTPSNCTLSSVVAGLVVPATSIVLLSRCPPPLRVRGG